MMELRKRRMLALAGTAVALSIALTGCSTINNLIGGGNDAQRDEDTGEVTEGSTIDIFSLKVGDCMPASSSTSGEMTDTDVVPCSEPHADEVFFEFELEDGDFPTEDEISAEVETQCVPAFTDFVGLDFQESALNLWWISPTEETWTQANDRLVQCVIYEPDPADETGETSLEITGSLEGAAR